MQNCGIERRDDGTLVIVIEDINRELGISSTGRSVNVAKGSPSIGNCGATLNAYRSRARQNNFTNLRWNLVGSRLEVSVIDMSVDLGPSSTGKTRIVAKGAETIDGDLTVQLSVWRSPQPSYRSWY